MTAWKKSERSIEPSERPRIDLFERQKEMSFLKASTSKAVCNTETNAVSAIIDRLLLQNTQLERSSLTYYNTSYDLNEAMIAAPLSVLAAVHFPRDFSLETKAEFTVQYKAEEEASVESALAAAHFAFERDQHTPLGLRPPREVIP